MEKILFIRDVNENNVTKILDAVDMPSIVHENDLCAVKTHFGEKNNKGYIKCENIRPAVEKIKKLKAKPFITDTNAMYNGQRSDAVSHLKLAEEHGFNSNSAGCPVIISGGLRGNSGVNIQVNKKHFKTISVAYDIYNADSIIFTSHFKGHVLGGFGAAIKNISMGCSTLSGKYSMHNLVKPRFNKGRCTGCAKCALWCPSGALAIESRKGQKPIIQFSSDSCIGCGECLHSCKNGVFGIPWDSSMGVFQEKMVEYVAGIIKDKRILCLNFLNFITADCDCMGTNGKPLIDNIGILAGTDPVAIDYASVELVNREFGADFVKHVKPNIDYTVQFKYAEEIGLGSTKYELLEIE